MKGIVALLGALALASGAQAATYDAFESFNGVQGAGGFFYLKLATTPGAPAVALTSSSPCIVTSDVCLQDGTALPGVYKSSTSFDEGSYHVPDDRLLIHPGAANPLGIFFVAPETADYDYEVSFNVLDEAPTGAGIASGTNASGTPVAVPLGAINASNSTLERAGTVSLAKGQYLFFILNNAGNFSNDSTGFNLTLTTAAVPEPAAWALMIMGFGLAGAVVRRRARFA